MAATGNDFVTSDQHDSEEGTLLKKPRTEECPPTSHLNSDGPQELTDGWQIDRDLYDCMLKMFDAQLWTDATFRCADQREENTDDRVRAHKIVLASRSPVFQAMFFGPLAEDGTKEIEIQDANANSFSQFLRSMYNDSVEFVSDIDELMDILAISHKYQVQYIVDKCCKELANQITIENSCLLLDKALLFSNGNLKEHAINFIDRNAKEVLMSDGYLHVSQECITFILKGNTFHAKEADIFTRTMEWAELKCESSDGQVLRKTLGEAFYYLRTPTMTNAELSTCTRRKGIYSTEEYEDIIEAIGSPGLPRGEILCNDIRKRYPKDIVKTGPQKTPPSLDASSSYFTAPSETLTLSAHANVYLSEITLINFKSVSTEVKQNRSYEQTKFLVENAPLSVTVKVNDEAIIDKHQQLSGVDPFTVELKSPYLLHMGETYKLQVHVQTDVVKNAKLEATYCYNYYIGEEEKAWAVPNNDIIGFKRKHDSNNAILIKSLKIVCVSYRELP